MTTVSVIYHSGFGHTKKQAESVIKGIQSAGATAHLINAPEWQDNLDVVNASDAIIFGSPTYMGSVSAPFKQFMDESSKIWFAQGWKNKIAAGFTNSASLSGDKLNTLIQMMVFSMQHGMIWVGPAQMSAGKTDGEVNRLGSFSGAMAQSENLPADVTPPAGDLRTAELLGTRVAEIAKQFGKK